MISNLKDTLKLNHDLVHILLPCIYFDIFSYPLTFDEIVEFSQHASLPKDRLKVFIEELVRAKYLYQTGAYYMIRNAPEMITQREENHQRAIRIMPKASRMSRIISRFPYVRAVFVSGSLSKGVLSSDGDIDYFIITHQDRLWVARTLLILYKKIFLMNSHKYFCLNYFIDDKHLKIEENNIYTATEIATLLPLYGYQHYLDFYHANAWVGFAFPNSSKRGPEQLIPFKTNPIKNLCEYVLKGQVGDFLNHKFMELTVGYWRRKFKSLDPVSFERAFKSTTYVSKHHPLDFQEKVLQTYKDRIRTFEEIHKVTLDAQY